MSRVRTDDEGVDLVLISMPFGILNHPSIALSLLSGSLGPMDVSSRIIHFTLPFAKIIGTSLYESIALGRHSTVDQVGEWIFSKALFPDHDTDSYINDVLVAYSPPEPDYDLDAFCQNILVLRDKVEEFLEWCLQEILRLKPKIIGFTSIFQQQVASLALAKRINKADPTIAIIFGGANCEGIMGIEVVRQFPFVDVAVSGEGDIVFPELISRMLNGKTVSDLTGVYTRNNIDLIGMNGVYPNAPSVEKMDSLPVPNYTEYFLQKDDLGLDNLESVIPYETSRGCWWGAKSHCTFCGLNGLTMGFRSKTAMRALDELTHMSELYPGKSIAAVDNILDTSYFKLFIPALIERQLDLRLFYEVKANLKKHQLQLMREAGIYRIQPGIESLSTSILRGMRKGIKSLQNIQLLKWCKEIDIEPSWNILWGFPGEDPNEYDILVNLLPLLAHLMPPIAAGSVRLDRFSPLFINSEQSGLRNVRPYPAYSYVYPALSEEGRANLAYYFTHDYADGRDVNEYTQHIRPAVAEWRKIHHQSEFYIVPFGSDILLWDLRPVAERMLTRLGRIEKELYLACDAVQGLNDLAKLAENHPGQISKEHVRMLLMRFVDLGLMLTENDSFLSLGVILSQDSPRLVAFQETLHVLEMLNKIPDYYTLDKVIAFSDILV